MSYEENFQTTNSRDLSQHTKAFLLQGASCTGSFLEGLYMNEEHLFISEPFEKLQEFCEWIDVEVGGAGRANIDQLWSSFNNQEDPLCQMFIEDTKKIMIKYKNL